MLTELSFSNFKSWHEVPPMRLAPITGFFGANSSGKTGILQLLLMLKQTVESPDRAQALIFGDDRTTPVNLGSYREVIHGHDPSSSLSWRIAWDLLKRLVVKDATDPKKVLLSSEKMAFEAELVGVGDRPDVARMTYQIGDRRFTMKRKGANGAKYELLPDRSDFRFVRTQGRAWDLPAPVKCYGFPDQVKAYFQNTGFLADLQLEFEKLFGRVYYLGPLREHPQRQYTWTGAEPADMGRRGERVVDALLGARGRRAKLGRGMRRSLEEHVAWWLRELGLVHSFHVAPVSEASSIYQVWVKKASGSAEVLLPDVGFGVSQILPALVLCYYVPEHSTIIMEQPEIHLHPSVQAGLADVFIDAVKRRRVQILFESHSEHLLRRLQLRVADERLGRDQIALYFCEMGGNHSTVRPLNVDLFGNITNWPKDFFGDQFGEMAAMTKAALGRKAKRQ